MTSEFNSWQSVQDEVLRRIHSRTWPPGAAIPNEAELAQEFGCARATVNRALQALADAGLLERKRRAGTRVALHPIRKATLSIPILRTEIEQRGATYGYGLIDRGLEVPPYPIRTRLGTGGAELLHTRALHTANGRPFVIEDRWVNLATIPAFAEVDLERFSANEWLVSHAPFTHGDIFFGADPCSFTEAEALGCAVGAAVFTVERTTWNATAPITWVRLVYAPGYRMQTDL